MQEFFIQAKKFAQASAQYSRDVLFAKECIGCQEPDILLCPNCALNLHAPKQESPLILSACRYEGIIRDIFVAVKIHKEHRYILLLADLVWKNLQNNPEFLSYAKHAQITYIPMHWMKLNMRGFNQSELLAREISRRLSGANSPVSSLRRGRLGLRQSSLTREGRILNVRGMFLASPSAVGKRILLIDDIRTTGATLATATQALLVAGALEVRCLTVAQD